MKKIVSLALCMILTVCLLSTPAAAQTDLTGYAIANGTVQAVAYDDITAPYSGTLLPFDWESGDAVSAGAGLFELMTANVTAPEDGTVRYLFADVGDSADAASATYGAVLALQPAVGQRIRCSYRGAANYEENKHLHVGDKLYFKVSKEKGVAVVIAVSGSGYEAEIVSGSFDAGKSLDLYKDSRYGSHDKVGTGTVYYRDDVMIAAGGRIAEILVAPGDEVKKGDVLLRVMSQDADADARPVIAADAAGVVDALAVIPGQQVWKGQRLCRVWRTDALEVVAQVDEMDLGSLAVGDTLPVTLDTDESRIMTGTVTEISSLGLTRQNAAYYSVHLSITDRSPRLGQSASVYLPKAAR